jgi:hypothetical protein
MSLCTAYEASTHVFIIPTMSLAPSVRNSSRGPRRYSRTPFNFAQSFLLLHDTRVQTNAVAAVCPNGSFWRHKEVWLLYCGKPHCLLVTMIRPPFFGVKQVPLCWCGGVSCDVFSKVSHGLFDVVFHLYAGSAVVEETDAHSQEYMVFPLVTVIFPNRPSIVSMILVTT